jgi:hypothetical protein
LPETQEGKVKEGLESHCNKLWGTSSGREIITWDVSLEHLLMPALEAYEHVSPIRRFDYRLSSIPVWRHVSV